MSLIPKAAPARWRRPAAALAVAAAALIAACGGGTTQYEPFTPERIVAFGDEASAFAPSGRTYAVNGLATGGSFDCNALPIWTQQLASIYGYIFAECNPTNAADVRGRTRAAAGARVADLAGQIDAQIAGGGMTDRDMVTVFIGTNDILDLYAQYPQRDEGSLLAEARARGQQVAAQVNRLIALGPRVIVSNLPDLGYSPFALTARSNNADIDRAALISRLTLAFNEQLGVSILLDGRFVALVQLDQRSQVIGRAPSALGFTDVSTAACTVAPPDCTTSTLATGADPNAWLWASDRWFTYAGHVQIATLAADRARRNPF